MAHPPYSLDLTLCNFVSLDEKKIPKGKHFASVEEVKPKQRRDKKRKKKEKKRKKTAEALKGIKINEFKNSLEPWKKLFNRCIASNGDYFEGE